VPRWVLALAWVLGGGGGGIWYQNQPWALLSSGPAIAVCIVQESPASIATSNPSLFLCNFY